MTLDEYVWELSNKLQKRYPLTDDQLLQVIDWYYDEIIYAWEDELPIESLIETLKNEKGNLDWRH